MRCFSRGVAVIATATVALSAQGSLASDFAREMLVEGSLTHGGKLRDASGPESMEVKVAEIQGRDESELKLELRARYSISKDTQRKQIYPVGSLEAVQELMSILGTGDEEQRDVSQYMNRYAWLLGEVLESYNEFYTVKVILGNPQLSPEDYKREQQKLPQLASKWTEANELLVAFLRIGARDLKDKWEQRSTAEKRLREVLKFMEQLAAVYEAQQRVFRTGYALAQLRFMEHPDRQADLSALINDPRQKQAVSEFEDALENFKERTHQARKAAASSVEDGILDQNYLTLLPFPPDRQREADDLPNDEM